MLGCWEWSLGFTFLGMDIGCFENGVSGLGFGI